MFNHAFCVRVPRVIGGLLDFSLKAYQRCWAVAYSDLSTHIHRLETDASRREPNEMSATETQGLCMTFSNLFIPHAFVCKCVLCVHRHKMSVRSSSELIKLSERRKDVLLFCCRPQKIDSGASFNFSLMKFHYQPLKSATYFITSVRSVCVWPRLW